MSKVTMLWGRITFSKFILPKKVNVSFLTLVLDKSINLVLPFSKLPPPIVSIVSGRETNKELHWKKTII